jgi:hypothetical protein
MYFARHRSLVAGRKSPLSNRDQQLARRAIEFAQRLTNVRCTLRTGTHEQAIALAGQCTAFIQQRLQQRQQIFGAAMLELNYFETLGMHRIARQRCAECDEHHDHESPDHVRSLLVAPTPCTTSHFRATASDSPSKWGDVVAWFYAKSNGFAAVINRSCTLPDGWFSPR